MKKNIFTLIWIFFFIIGFSVSAHSGAYIYLHLTDIEGESIAIGYEGWIDVLNWSWELNNSNDYFLRNPREMFVSPIMLKKYVDKSSPELVLNLLTGGLINEAILVINRTGSVPYLKITLSNVIVSYLSPSISPDDDPISPDDDLISEILGLNFKNICYEYTPQNPDGSPGAAIEKCWSR